MSILSVDQIQPIGSGTTVTLNATEVKTGTEITVGTGASIFSPAGNTLTLGTNNVERFRITNAGAFGLSGTNYGSTGQVLTSQGSGSAPTWTSVSTPLSNRNRIINGALQIWQRGTSINSQGNGQNDYTADRFAIGHNNSHMAAVTQQDGTGTNAGFRYCARIQRDSGNSQTDQMRFHTALETHDVVPLRGNVLTISYYARKGANYSEANSKITGVRIATGTNTDGDPNAYSGGHWTNSTTLLTGTPTLTTSWQRFSHTTSAVPSGANSMIIEFRHTPVGTAGANDWYEITGVQLEIGTTATTFEHRSIGEELIRCQRYFQFVEYAHAIARSSTNTGSVSAKFACEMRIGPTIGTMNLSTKATNVGLNLQGDSVVNTTQSSGNQGTSYSSQRSMYLYDMSGFGGMTAGRSYFVGVPANNAVVFTADAEL